ncbi:hypothetical protein ACROYT_G038775 [Oculina patagonica]
MSPPLSTGVTTMEPYHPRPRYQPDYLAGQYPVITEQPASNTTPVVTQQAVVIQAVRPTDLRDWNSQLCGCFEDWGSLCMGIWCPICLMVDVSSRMGEGCCLPFCCGPGALLGLRIKLRVQQNIKGSLMDDYCAVQCCPLCVLCQLSRELRHSQLTNPY